MTIVQAVVLAIVQGATEFVPISSSGHLVLVREFLHWSDEGGVLMDTMLHAASLLAILIYFRQDWRRLAGGIWRWSAEAGAEHRKLLWLLAVASLPVVFAGPFIAEQMACLRNGRTVGLIMILTALWFLFCEGRRDSGGGPVSYRVAVVMGVAQVFALMPGASRSGLTISAGRLCRRSREDAARFSFLMAVPTIAGAILYEAGRSLHVAVVSPPWGAMAIGFVVCFIVSMASIHFCLSLFKRHSLMVFAAYLAVLGTVLVLLHAKA